MNARPPRLLAWLLQRLLDTASRDAVAGDLEEEYRHLRTRRGMVHANAWYAKHAARSVVACRVTGRRRADYRPMDFDTGGHVTLRDLVRPALRQFRDHPLYTFACAATLAFAIAAACTAFAVVKRAFLDPLPYAHDDELVSILTASEGRHTAVSPHVLEDLRASQPLFSGFAPIRPFTVAYQSADGAQPVTANVTTPEYFSVLGVQPVMGRVFAGRESAVIVSWRFWQRTLGSDPTAIGSQVTIDGQTRTIVGIMPEWFVPPYWSQNEVWLPLDYGALLANVRGQRTLTIIARRVSHVTERQVDAFLATCSRELQEKYPADHGRMSWVAIPLRDELVGSSRAALIGTAGAAALLLLIVGANIAGLSTAHAAATRQQIAIRAALGATRARLLLGHVVDSAVVAAIGTAAGIWMAYGLVTIAAGYQRQFLERLVPIALDAPTVLVTAVVGMMVGVFAALLPRRLLSGARLMDSLQARGASGDTKAMRLRTTLVVAQVALALVLVVGAGLLVRTVSHLSQLSLGFNSERLATFQVTLPPGPKYQASAAQIQFERDVVERLRSLHGVSAATASIGFPVIGGMMAGLTIQGRPQERGLDEIAYWSLAPDFMSTVGARVVTGRDLTESDHDGAPRVVLINETMARMFWPSGDALGAQVQIGPGSPNQRWITVVGIISDVSDLGPTERIRPTAYGSTRQYSWPRRNFTVRSGDAVSLSLAVDVRAAVAAVDPAVPVGTITTVDRLVSDRVGRHRLVMLALGLFGSVALMLSAAGVYGVVALTSRLRRREYAIRMALGAARGGVRWLVIRQALVVSGAGTLAGVAAAAAATQSARGLLHGVTALDPATFAIAALIIPSLAVIAAWLPASQAERVDPVETLRSE